MASSSYPSEDTVSFSSYRDLAVVATRILREAMTNERSRRWPQVINNYRRLLRMLSKENLPPYFEPPVWYSMLHYECHYHLGMALQHVGEARRAASQYTRAINSVLIPKNGCLAGCHSNSCLMTPLHARRAYAYGKYGDLKNCMKDAEKSVVLDSTNPDVYCIRALAWSTLGNKSEAIKDAQKALDINPNHICGLVLKGSLTDPLVVTDWSGTQSVEPKQQHLKACSINPDCHAYLDLEDFTHPDFVNFYDRFLYSLNVPHTISEITFPSTWNSPVAGRIMPMNQSPHRFRQRPDQRCNEVGSATAPRPFRCGTPGNPEYDRSQLCRRREYSEAIRKHILRPKTAEEYIAYLERERSKHLNRPNTTANPMDLEHRLVHQLTVGAGRPTRTTQTQTISYNKNFTHSTASNVQVFQPVNVKNAPRMYYRPWIGDKLPVADKDRKKWEFPPFR